MAWQVLFGEHATTKIAAIFDTESAAATAAATLHSETGIQATQLRLIKPHETEYSKKIEPETSGIARTAIRAHVGLGLAGAAAGLLIWALLYAIGVNVIVSSPRGSLIAFLFFAGVGGMMLGGLITARPDHQIVIQRVKSASEDGLWSLVVHPRTPKQCDEAIAVLSRLGPEIVRSV